MMREKYGADAPGKHDRPSASMRFRLSSLAAILFLGVAAIALAYIGGVMSGRHGEQIKSLPDTVEQTDGLKDGAPREGEEEEKILAAEELKFAHVLRHQNLPDKAASEKPETIPQSGSGNGNAPAPEQDLAEIIKQNPGIMDYVFQAGTFREEAGADSLRQKLEGYGLRTRLERNGKFFVVLILLRGDEKRALEVISISRELKLGQLILRSRKQTQ